SGTAEWRASSSRGSASPTRGPRAAIRGRSRYSQPVAATSTASPPSPATTTRAAATALPIREPSQRREERARGVAAPERPVVTAADDEVAVRDSRSRELRREGGVLVPEPVLAPRVEP